MLLPNLFNNIHYLQANNVNISVSLQALHADEIDKTLEQSKSQYKYKGSGNWFLIPDLHF